MHTCLKPVFNDDQYWFHLQIIKNKRICRQKASCNLYIQLEQQTYFVQDNIKCKWTEQKSTNFSCIMTDIDCYHHDQKSAINRRVTTRNT